MNNFPPEPAPHAVRRYRVGNATVTRITEQVLAVPSTYLYPQWETSFAEQNVHWLGAGHISTDLQSLALSIHSWVIQIDGKTLLIDTASGNGKQRPLNPIFHQLDTLYLQRLKAAGVSPEDVDLVLITHLHVDHVGWNTRLHEGQWVPTFPNAKYLFSKPEYDFYGNPENVQDPSAGVFEDSVQPIVEAGLALWFDADGHGLLPGIAVHSTKGHSYDHLSFSLESGGQHALFSGDVMHHPIQVARPEWNSVFCEFQEDARRSRLWALEYAAAHEALFFSSHFADTSVGVVRRQGEQFQWRDR